MAVEGFLTNCYKGELFMRDEKNRNAKQNFFAGKRKWIVIAAAAVVAVILIVALVIVPMNSQPEPVSTPAPTPTQTMPDKTPAPTPSAQEKQILPQLKELYEQNGDLAGWIKIEGTKIDYPVMYTPQDPEFYLYRTFEKQEDPTKEGSIFVDANCTLEPRGDNLLIHGHNMKNGTMFHTLLEYEKEAFYKEHPVIEFSTLYSADKYEIAAVFLSKIYNKDDDVFKFYKFYDAQTKEEYDHFVQNIKELELYETGITPEFGDELITLSTCEYSQDNGRIVVVARKITEPQAGASVAPSASTGDTQTVTGEITVD